MAQDISNRQLLQVMNTRFDDLTLLINSIGETVVDIADNMITAKDLERFEARMTDKFDAKLNGMANMLNDTELRLGRRIDTALLAKTST